MQKIIHLSVMSCGVNKFDMIYIIVLNNNHNNSSNSKSSNNNNNSKNMTIIILIRRTYLNLYSLSMQLTITG